MPDSTDPISGLNSKITVDTGDGEDTTIVGMSVFTLGADTRNILDIPKTMDTERAGVLVQSKQPISFSFEGYYLPDDTGQDYLRERFDGNEEIVNIKFWIDSNSYFTPALNNHLKISSIGEVSTSANGFGSFSCSGFFYHEYQEVFTS